MEGCNSNLLLLCFALLFNQSAYITLENIQSTLNQARGTTALAVLYACFFTSSFILPTYLISRFGCKRTLTITMTSYSLYIVVNFYPKDYTLIPAAAILGSCSSVMWATVLTYVVRLSQNSTNCIVKAQALTQISFSLLFSFVNFSLLLGTTIMAVLLATMRSRVEAILHNKQSNLSNSFETIYNESLCLLGNTSGLLKPSNSSQRETTIEGLTLYLILGTFLLLNTIGVILTICLKEYPNHQILHSLNDATAKPSRFGKVSDDFGNFEGQELQLNLAKQIDERVTVKNNEIIEPIKEAPVIPQSPASHLKATFQFVFKNIVAVMLAPHTMHIGILQAFIRGSYNGSWVSCQYGVAFVSYTMLCLSSSMLITSLSSGKLLSIVNHRTLFGIAFLIEMGCLLALLLWTSSGVSWPFFILSAGLGSSHAILKSQTPSYYTNFFTNCPTEAASWQVAMESIGTCLAYGLMSRLSPIYLLYFVLTFLVVGYLLLLGASFIQHISADQKKASQKRDGIE